MSLPLDTSARDTRAKAARRKIDVHSHFLPEAYRHAAIAAGHDRPDGMPALPQWSVDKAVALMDEAGIATSMLSISSPGIHFGDEKAVRDLARLTNEEGAALKARMPSRFGIFAVLPLPDIEGALAEIAYAFDVLSVDGVVLFTNQTGIYPGDPRFEPVFAELDRRDAVVFLHPTSPCCACGTGLDIPRPILEFMFETSRAVADLLLSGTLNRHPRIRLIVPHAGATLPAVIDRLLLFAPMLQKAGAETPADMANAIGRLYFDTAGVPLPTLLPALLSFADPKRVMYGSDWPFTPDPVVLSLIEKLEAIDHPAVIPKALWRGNAEMLFPRLLAP